MVKKHENVINGLFFFALGRRLFVDCMSCAARLLMVIDGGDDANGRHAKTELTFFLQPLEHARTLTQTHTLTHTHTHTLTHTHTHTQRFIHTPQDREERKRFGKKWR